MSRAIKTPERSTDGKKPLVSAPPQRHPRVPIEGLEAEANGLYFYHGCRHG